SMVFCTIFTALDLIRVVISFRISVTTRLLAWRLSRFRICFPLGFLDTHSRSKMPSKKFGARPPARPKNFFSTSRFSIADWKGGMGHGFEKFICLLQNHLQRFRCFPPLYKIFEPSKLRHKAGAKDLRQVKTR